MPRRLEDQKAPTYAHSPCESRLWSRTSSRLQPSMTRNWMPGISGKPLPLQQLSTPKTLDEQVSRSPLNRVMVAGSNSRRAWSIALRATTASLNSSLASRVIVSHEPGEDRPCYRSEERRVGKE